MSRHDQWMAIQAAIESLRATQHDLQAMDDAEAGNLASAEWNRLAARAIRSPSPEAEAAADRAWVATMADMHLRMGTVPRSGSHRAVEIEQAMDAIRDAELRADRPSREVAVPEEA